MTEENGFRVATEVILQFVLLPGSGIRRCDPADPAMIVEPVPHRATGRVSSLYHQVRIKPRHRSRTLPCSTPGNQTAGGSDSESVGPAGQF
jgi:hypothetical protein